MELSEAARGLREKAASILKRTGWPELFTRRFGAHAVTGSVRYDLMVWPDIDIHMPVEPGRRLEWAALLAELATGLDRAGLRLHTAQFLDDYVDPHPLGAGLYWGLNFREPDGTIWKADLWGWAPDDYARRQARDAELIAALAGADRALVLRLKAEARRRPDYYGTVLGSMDIYRFVLAGAGDTLEAAEAWKAGI